MNGVNLNHFQFEYDLTWMSFFQNHLGQTYLRYGGREDIGPETHLNQKSLARAMKLALQLHQDDGGRKFGKYEPSNNTKQTPEQIPSMQKMIVNRQNKCIHCHDVKAARLRELRAGDALRKEMVFTYPSPLNLGIQIDAIDQNQIKSIGKNSAAESSGLRRHDVIQSINDQPVHTFADATRVLELAPDKGQLKISVIRDGQKIDAEIKLTDKWKTLGDPSWRESSHVVGPNSGFWGVRLNPAERTDLKLGADKLAIRTTAIWGQWARKAGIKNRDVVISIDGQDQDRSIKQLQSYLQMNKQWGDKVSLSVLRNRKPVELEMELPKQPDD